MPFQSDSTPNIKLPLDGRRQALIIGNGSYEWAPVLRNPPNDASAISLLLKRVGFSITKATDLTRNAMEDALGEFESQIHDAEVAVLFYAGHGLQVKGRNYLIPVDAEIKLESHLKRRTFAVDDILELMVGKARSSLLFLDACRDNPFGRSLLSGANQSERSRLMVGRGLAEQKISRGAFIAFATAPDNVALDGSGDNSPFTEGIVAHLETEDQSVNDMMIAVRLHVLQATADKQEPWELSSLRQRFCFVPRKKFSGNQASLQADESQGAGGRILVEALIVNNGNGNLFLPGAGKTEWFKDHPDGPEMVLVPSGHFMMGSLEDEWGRWDDGREDPYHQVAIQNVFAIGRHAITRGQFAAFVESTNYQPVTNALIWNGKGWNDGPGGSWQTPGILQDDSHPVVCVTHQDAIAYVNWLANITGKKYRLPSEAEWEYATRATKTSPFWWGTSISTRLANYDGNFSFNAGPKGEYRGKTVPVSSFEANSWGLYAVHGNVWEWCDDIWHDSYKTAPSDGSAWTDIGDSALRVVRGGSWLENPAHLRSADRIEGPDKGRNDVGFRVVMAFGS